MKWALAALAAAAAPCAFGAQDYAEVLAATPVYRQVQVVVPEQQCYPQRVVADNGYGSNVAAGSMLGGVAGGVIGNQIGSGAGKAVATVAGAMLGLVTGQKIAAANSPAPTETTVQRCTVVNAYHVENQLDGYDVTYRCYGQIYHTHLNQDPGPRLLVQIDVAPALY